MQAGDDALKAAVGKITATAIYSRPVSYLTKRSSTKRPRHVSNANAVQASASAQDQAVEEAVRRVMRGTLALLTNSESTNAPT